MTLTRTDIAIRIVSIVLAVGMCLLLQPSQLFGASLVLGQGHFMLAYLYAAEGGHFGMRKFLILCAVFLSMLWLGDILPLQLFTALIGGGFLIHFCMDEIRLLGGKHSLFTTLEAAPTVLMYTAIIMHEFLHIRLFVPALLAMGACVLVYTYLAVTKRRAPNVVSYALLGYFVLTTILFWVASAVAPSYPYQWFIGFGLVHYFIWYGYYWFKLAPKPVLQRTYLLRTVVLNGLLLIGVLFFASGNVAVLAVLFSPIMFDVWVALHGAATFRMKEYGSALRLS